ncbi:sensor histidine kinase [Rhizobium sp. NRK18]|uniref:sensor histidine kinase n=1 Tax=Rhizobium sp. NRK18 TaxID=2964667 RepID=UPI0021C4216C|nr:HAMP domain-containing sensor histidine kinase [Rhizobium sp. NRK18]MCQ2004249.1 HAMP domain-containing histidine kinase [Rhizobium sp. NRK18]
MKRILPKPRFVAIAALVVIILWIAVAAILYIAAIRRQPPPVSPLRFAAIVRLAETLNSEGRADLARFVGEPGVTLQFEPGDTLLKEPPPSPDLGALTFAAYAMRVAPRKLEIVTPQPDGLRRIAPRFLLRYPPITIFRVALLTGDTLTITARSPLLSNVFAVPPGILAGLVGSLLALAVLFGVVRATRSLERLADALDRTDLSGTPERLPPYRGFGGEVGRLVEAYNRLQDRLTVLLQNRMALIGGISHDVRTFATRLRLRLDAIEDEAERERAAADIDDMIRLLDDALIASRIGAGELTEELVDVREILAQEFAARREAGAAIAMSLDGDDDALQILGDRLAVRRIIANLVDNGLKYGQQVHLSGGVSDGKVMIVVEDNGPGIPADQREAVMEPFFRLEASRSRGTGGAGLGLAVVKALTEGLGGSVALDSAAGGGARVEVLLPEFSV